MTEECEPATILPERIRAACQALFQNSAPGQIFKISRNLCVVSLSPTEDINWLTSTLSKAKAAASEPSNGTSSATPDTSTPAKEEICILLSLNSSGHATYLGQEIPGRIESWPSSRIIDITIGDSCAKRLATGLTTAANLPHSQLRLRLISNSLKTSNLNTSAPSPHIFDGTNGCDVP